SAKDPGVVGLGSAAREAAVTSSPLTFMMAVGSCQFQVGEHSSAVGASLFIVLLLTKWAAKGITSAIWTRRLVVPAKAEPIARFKWPYQHAILDSRGRGNDGISTSY